MLDYTVGNSVHSNGPLFIATVCYSEITDRKVQQLTQSVFNKAAYRVFNKAYKKYIYTLNVPSLSCAFTSAPRSSRACMQASLSDSSLARSRGLLS